jgi:serine/threonine protein phosphatase PrpC
MSLRPVVHAYGLARSRTDASEDAYAVDVASGRFALADGASSAWRAGDWAAALVAAWVDAPVRSREGLATAFARTLAATQESFTDEDRGDGEREWFTEAAAERGAHAALLGLRLVALDGRRPRWRALAVGDVCAFHVRGDQLLAAVPIDDPARFTSRPDLLSSIPGERGPEPVMGEGELRAGDLLVLATDALAAFLLRLDARSEPVWAVVRALDVDRFRVLVAQGIAAGLLERDDTTLVRIVVEEDR